jgi:hypothetical protein
MPRIVQPYYSIQYDGTNGEYIAGTWCTGITFVSDTGTLLTYTENQNNHTFTINLNDWVIVWGAEATDPWTCTPAAYAARYYELPE